MENTKWILCPPCMRQQDKIENSRRYCTGKLFSILPEMQAGEFDRS